MYLAYDFSKGTYSALNLYVISVCSVGFNLNHFCSAITIFYNCNTCSIHILRRSSHSRVLIEQFPMITFTFSTVPHDKKREG